MTQFDLMIILSFRVLQGLMDQFKLMVLQGMVLQGMVLQGMVLQGIAAQFELMVLQVQE